MNKPVNDRKTLMARGIIAMMLMASLLQILAPLPTDERVDIEPPEIEPQIVTAMATPSTSSPGDLSKGGYHLKTGDWWEGKLDYIPSANDPDADGIDSNLDSHPWNRNLGSSVKDCSSGCEGGLPPNVEASATMPDFTDDGFDQLSYPALGDMNGDGSLDLVFSSGSYLYLSLNVLGEFTTPTQVQHLGSTIYNVKLADFDNDGDNDIVVGDYYRVRVIEMNGTTSESVNQLLYGHYSSTYNRYKFIDIGDVNDDGLPDLIIGGEYGQFYQSGFDDIAFRLFLNEYSSGNGMAFSNVWNYTHTNTDVNAYYPGYAVTFNDFDADGDDDVFISAYNHSSTPCMDSNSYCYAVMGFHAEPTNDPPLGTSPDYMFDIDEFGSNHKAQGIVSGDLNADGYNELVIATSVGKLYALWNLQPTTGTAEYGQEETTNYSILYDKGFNTLDNMGLVDINNDGLLDIYSGSKNTGGESTILICTGLGSGGDRVEFEFIWNSTTGSNTKIVIGDIDGNGFNDIIISPSGTPISYHRTGAGTLAEVSSMTMSTSGYASGFGGVIDYDGDGDDDLMVYDNSNISFYEFDAGAFSSTPSNWVNEYVYDVAKGDFNYDGFDDLVTAYKEIEVRWGSSDGYNSSPDVTLNPGNSTDRFKFVHIDDLDGDGLLDISFDSYSDYSDYAYVYTYDGNGDFEQAWRSRSMEVDGANYYEKNPREIAIVDVNGDGLNDYVQCHYQRILVYNGTTSTIGMDTVTNFSASPYEIVAVPYYIYDCVFDDFNNDGHMDMIQLYSGSMYVLNGPLIDHDGVWDDYFYAQSTSYIQLEDIDMDGNNDVIAATYSSKRSKAIRYVGPDTEEVIWEGGAYRSTNSYHIGDINDDGLTDMVQFNYGSNTELILGVSDFDMDGYADSVDEFQSNPTQHSDTDGDGYGDNPDGFEADDCVYYWGDSTQDRRGCTDQDQDGYSDLNDAFWRDVTQWNDTDGDGFGDNFHSNSGSREAHWPGELVSGAQNSDSEPLDYDNDGYEDDDLADAIAPFDDCKMTAGESYEDAYGCLDSDLDGWSNLVDVFPMENTQHNDSDGDGFGDNPQGWLGDSCPNDYGTSVTDVFGCVDADSDGWSYINDFDDNDTSEYVDNDNDGLGDLADQCPYVWSNLTTGPDRGCQDLDGDGWADRSDDFPTEPTQSKDMDGDGYGDNASGTNPDDFTMDSTQWSDSDGDGKGDNPNGNNPDAFPNDNSQWRDTDGDGYGDEKGGNNPDMCIESGTSEQRLYPNGTTQEWYGCPDADEDKIPDKFDDCQNTAGYSYLDRIGCIDSEEDGISDLNDPYVYDYAYDAGGGDWDDDGVKDLRPSFNLTGSDVFPNDWTQWADSDNDGYGDNPNGEDADWDKDDPSQWKDSDGDGHGDNSTGTNGDACPNEWGDSSDSETGLGCPDSDGDGVRDTADDFKYDSGQVKDSDGDGYGDAEDGDESDAFPNDSTQWSDRDADGYGDNPDGNDSDAFPYDSTQWSDKDGDGYGDNPAGTDADDCVNSAGTSYRDRTGCVDQDDDGYSDINDKCISLPGWSEEPFQGCPDRDDDGFADVIDAFPDDDTENIDTDGDGIGDGSDYCFVVVWEEDYSYENDELIDCTQDRDNDGRNDSVDQYPDDTNEWIDTDGDDVGDNQDVWPNQGEIWSDVDQDGYADQYGHMLTDDCPFQNGTSTKFMQGCSDMDFDGMPDLLDPDADGDGITNDNEMDASTKDEEYDPFDNQSTPPDMDSDGIPDKLDKDTDGDGFPNQLESERGSDYRDANLTPFNLYGEQDTGLFYIPGEGFKSQYDPEGIELSVSALIDILTGEFLLPLMMIPITIFALLRKGRRYKKMRKSIDNCKDFDILTEYETDIDDVIMKKKIKVEHGMLLRNLFERKREQLDTKKSISGLKRSSSGNRNQGGGGGGMNPRGNQGQQGGGQQGPQRPSPGPGRQRPGGGQQDRKW